jgi:hypothetical protein
MSGTWGAKPRRCIPRFVPTVVIVFVTSCELNSPDIVSAHRTKSVCVGATKKFAGDKLRLFASRYCQRGSTASHSGCTSYWQCIVWARMGWVVLGILYHGVRGGTGLGDLRYFFNFLCINLVFTFRCSSSPSNRVNARRVDSSVLVFSLSSHRHS